MKYKLIGFLAPFILPSILIALFFIGIRDFGLSLYILIICLSFLTPLFQLAVYFIYKKRNYPFNAVAVGMKYSLILVIIILIVALFNQDTWLI